MNTKKIVQFILIIFLLFLNILFYKKYFQTDNEISEDKKETIIDNEKIKMSKLKMKKRRKYYSKFKVCIRRFAW